MEKEMKIESQPNEAACCKASNEPTYEQLKDYVNSLMYQNNELAKRYNEMEMGNFFKRLDWLWNIINSTTPYITEDFKAVCGEEFMTMMAKPEEETTTE